MSSLSFIKKISINSAVLNQDRDNLNNDRIVTLQTTVEQTAQRGENPLEALQGLRLRILVATNPRCAQVNDFVSQRLNEYIDLGDAGLFMPEDRFIRQMDTDLKTKLYVNFFDVTPFGPYVTYDRVVDSLFSPEAPQINAPSMSRASRMTEVPLNTIVYDVNLESLLPLDPAARGPIANDLARPRYVRGSSTDLEPYTLAPIQISLSSVLPNLLVPNQVNLEQLTFYAFIYVPSIPDQPGLEVPPNDEIQALSTGMSKIEVANVRGVRTLFPPISRQDFPMLGDAGPRGENRREIVERDNKNPLSEKYLFVPDFVANAEILNLETRAKEGDIFQTFNIGLEQEINTRFTKIYDLFYGDIFASNLFGGQGAKNIIQDDNFFSDFYLSRDMSGNVRYTFAFDIRSFLAKNSYFPYLYLNKYSSNQLIQGTGLLDMSPRSRVLSVIMKRRRVERVAQNLGNNLGTDARTVVLGPDKTFPIKYLNNPRAVKVFQENNIRNPGAEEMSTSKIIFYEGEDIFGKKREKAGLTGSFINVDDNSNQENGEFQYGSHITVFDNAPEYVRRLINLFREYRSDINQIYDTITLSQPTSVGYQGGIVRNDRDLFNYQTTKINVRLNDIETFVGDRRQFVSDVLNEILASVDRELQALVSLKEAGLVEGSIVPYFQRQFELNNVDPRSLLDLDDLIGLVIGFFIGKLTEIFPNDPFGELTNYQPNLFESTGYSNSSIPIKTAEMWFSNTFTRGETFNYGNDFIFQDKGLEKRAGLNSLSIEKYQERVEDEFRKYFQSITEGMYDYNQIPEPYLSSATQYFTPAIIQTPRRPFDRHITQPDYASRTGNRAAYDINQYAVMFADIGKLHFQNHYLNTMFNSVNNPQPSASPNVNLFAEVLENLSTYYSTDIEVGETKVYEAPSVQRGEFPPTVSRTDYTLTLSSAGPFVYVSETPPVIPDIMGGPLAISDEGVTEKAYRDSIDVTISQNYDRNKIEATNQNKTMRERNKSNTPIKLPFAIFGEIFVDPEPIFDVSYQDRVFNSLTKLATTLGITSDNAVRSVEDFFGDLPNQTKSAIVLAASDKVKDLGEAPNLTSFDAVRPELQDKDSGEREDLISCYETREVPQNDTYPLTRDPAKVYAKFITFWMNYKNIAVVEYLSRYGNLNNDPESIREIYNGFELDQTKDLNLEYKTAIPVWQPLTPQILSEVVQQDDDSLKLLCRVRLKSSEEMRSLLDPKTAQALEADTVVEDFFAEKSMLVLTTYNKYFFLQRDEPDDKIPPPRNPPKSPPEENPQILSPGSLGGAVGLGIASNTDPGLSSLTPRDINSGGYR